jgi:hypothetical protein
MVVPYTSSHQDVLDVVGRLGRTEDIKFSPNYQRFAVAGFSANKVVLFDFSVEHGPERKLMLTGASEIFSESFDYPHGLDFIDDDSLIVANRNGSACILRLPKRTNGAGHYEISPSGAIAERDLLDSPGSVSVNMLSRGRYEVLICDNFGHKITRHMVTTAGCYSVQDSSVLLQKHIDIPDGICVSNDRRWIVVSNHNKHCVFVYSNDGSLNASTDPRGILKGIYYPHGLRFTADGRCLLVADAAAPFVRIYKSDHANWQGVHYPFSSYRVMSDEIFMQGRGNPQEGGPKGIDIHESAQIFVTTNELQPLAFFDLPEMLSGRATDSYFGDRQSELEVTCELELEDQATALRVDAESRAAQAEALAIQAQREELRAGRAELRAKAQAQRAEKQISLIRGSRSWRATAPFRWAFARFNRPGGG